MSPNDHSQLEVVPSNDVDNLDNNMPSQTGSQGVMDEHEIGEEEGRNILEVIASTGKFWLDWEKLKSLLSFQLKKVLSEYPEVKMSSEDQNSLLGETFAELVKRLDGALCSFIEGPPFTLQRLCEIFLSARVIYPKLSKLALALEKNLLVSSTLTISTDPYPPSMVKPSEEIGKIEEPQSHANSVQNGVEHVTSDKDEVMAEVEAADSESNDNMKVDEASDEKGGSPNPDPMPTTDS